ncbi:bacteriorhodopsin [Leptolyngbyaceae cyanobacterium JSC-12]|nr:bacteriorhodopsin [Leptolyngbyaceae cyanobacterium JSC-12]
MAQFDLVYNSFSFCIAAMAAAALFFFNARVQVAEKYRPALLVSALVVSIAAYHYFRIFNGWDSAYALQGGIYVATGTPFNDAYRYADWLLTVPLLLIEAVAVLALAPQVSRSMVLRLAAAAVIMIATGYPGEIASSLTARLVWGTVSTIPFVYILYVLWIELSKAIDRQPPEVKGLVKSLRWLLLLSWGVYPIAYLLPALGITGAAATVGVQVGYTIADVLAKPIFGLYIFAIANAKTKADQVANVDEVTTTQPVLEGIVNN